jgi:hypothetical protein
MIAGVANVAATRWRSKASSSRRIGVHAVLGVLGLDLFRRDAVGPTCRARIGGNDDLGAPSGLGTSGVYSSLVV